MYEIYLKRILRNKWVLAKIFVFSPIVSILPILLLDNNFSNTTFERILNLCMWNYMYFILFENLNMNMASISNGKIYDILLSQKGIWVHIKYQKLALMSAFFFPYTLSLFAYILLFQLKINIFVFVIATINLVIFTYIICDLTMYFELRFRNYFNKFNFAMNIIFIASGILYPMGASPCVIRAASYIMPLSLIFDYVYTKSAVDIVLFLGLSILLKLLMNILIDSAIQRIRKCDLK